jgi:hypothetical protein
MPERGQTIFAAENVGFSKTKKSNLLFGSPQGLPVVEKDNDCYVFIFSDGLKTILCPISDKVRKDLIEAMRKAPLEVVTSPNGGPDAPF